jgi:hypothetical protein
MSVIELEALSRVAGEIAFEFLVRSCMLFAAGGLALIFLRSRSAEIRHFAVCGVLYGFL